MQTLIHVVSSKPDSLRKKIANDPRLEKFKLQLAKQKQMGRSPGWLTLHSTYSHGAIKVEWIDSSRTLLCRIITRGGGKPHDIVGDFVRYIFTRFRRRIEAITIVPR
jgi:hypothetical protein